MKKFFLLLIIILISAVFKPVLAQTAPVQSPPDPCQGSWCPAVTSDYTCATDYNAWLTNKSQNLWVSDPEVTALGKAGERSRQFLYWALTHRSIDDHPVILSIWSFAKNMVYFFLLIVAAIFGLGIIIGQRANFNLKIEVWPLILKILLLLLYVTFSARIVLLVIQLSDTMMLFFIERLGVRNLFNIFFLSSGGSVILDSETAYKTFKGCSNINADLLDSVNTSKFMVHFTNMTYYMLGIMFILRKIVLWLLLFVSPFLALLLPFVFIKNIGWIWIGVFFQWVFYGPLFGLFLGGLAAIWGSQSHIPFNFDFSRTNKIEGFIYPTTINILYGGPAQKLELLNSSNYADTFAEYIISLIMLWAVTIFPWWLLRIFRDYCCDGIYATKNILLSMYDQMRGGTPNPFVPAPVPASPGLSSGASMQMPKEETVRTVTKFDTTEEIRKAKTEDISRSLQFRATNLTDIAKLETNKQNKETLSKNINFLQNPMRAETPTERQKYMNIRSELFSRAVKEDKTAKQVLSSLSTSKVEQQQSREEILKTTSQSAPISNLISVKVKLPAEKVQSATSSFIQSVAQNNTMVQSISSSTQTSQNQVQSVLSSYAQNISQPASNLIQSVVKETGVTKEKVTSIIQNTANFARQTQLIDKISVKEQIGSDKVEKILTSISTSISKDISVTVEKVTPAQITALSSNQIFVSEAEKKTSLPSTSVNNILNTYSQNISQPLETTINNISTQTGINKESVREVINSANNYISATSDKSKETIVSVLASQSSVPAEKVSSITKQLISSVSADRVFIKQVEKQTGLQANQVNKVLNLFTQNLNQPMSTAISNISNQTGIEKEKVTKVINTTISNLKTSQETVKQIAKKENIKENELQKIVQNQIQVAAEPEKNVESTIAIPPSISLDEYEQVKKMWKDQYVRGEVPVSDVIKTRDEWVGQDVVFITNVLNKLVAENPEVKQKGLDDLGYILPIFLINNLKGDQLMVYLKAKLEAAKEVEELQEKEKEVKEETEEKNEEELVEVPSPGSVEKDQENTMEMQEETEKKVDTQTPPETTDTEKSEEVKK